MIKQMLGDMKHFKMILRKSLNLIQGMEMMNQGYINNIASNYDGRCSNGTDKFGETNQWACAGHGAFPVLGEDENDLCKVSYLKYGPDKSKKCACKTDYCNYPASQPDFQGL